MQHGSSASGLFYGSLGCGTNGSVLESNVDRSGRIVCCLPTSTTGFSMSNLERAQNLADSGQYEASIARSLIVIAAALKMQVEPKEEAFLPLLNEEEATRLQDDWCEDPNCGNRV